VFLDWPDTGTNSSAFPKLLNSPLQREAMLALLID
jgi:hypothetical protein